MVQLQDEPIADPVCVPVYYVSKLARDNGVDRLPGRAKGPTSCSAAIPAWQRCLLKLQRLDRSARPEAVKRVGLAGLQARWARMTHSLELLRRGALGSRSSGAAPRPSPQTQKRHCCRRACVGSSQA